MSTNLKYAGIIGFARDRIANQNEIKPAISTALGIATSRRIQLPSSPVDDAYGYYASNVSYTMADYVAQFNENLVVDVDLAMAVGRAFWLKRYFEAYPMFIIPVLSEDEGHFMNKLSGIGHLVNPATFELLSKNASSMIVLINKIRELEGVDLSSYSAPVNDTPAVI